MSGSTCKALLFFGVVGGAALSATTTKQRVALGAVRPLKPLQHLLQIAVPVRASAVPAAEDAAAGEGGRGADLGLSARPRIPGRSAARGGACLRIAVKRTAARLRQEAEDPPGEQCVKILQEARTGKQYEALVLRPALSAPRIARRAACCGDTYCCSAP